MTDKGMPEKIWAGEDGEWSKTDDFYGVYATFIRSDIVEELIGALDWYNDGRDPVVSEVMSRIKAIMEGK